MDNRMGPFNGVVEPALVLLLLESQILFYVLLH